jgi:hypothetical protein
MEELGFEEFMQRAISAGFTSIQVDGGTAVALRTWQGVSVQAAGGPGDFTFVTVRYFLEGNRLRVRKDFHGDFWYTLGVGLTPNQRLKVTEDIQRILREKPNATQEETFERLNVAYTGVGLADVKAVLESIRRENQ